jgi:mannose-6-phosphate isomerase-like protein (cupin superfamily)
MTDTHDPLHLSEAAPLDGNSFLRPVVTGGNGSSTLAWHAEIPAGGSLGGYALAKCDVTVVLLAGEGVAWQGGERMAIRAGHCRLVPAGLARGFRNGSESAPAVLAGFWPGAADPLAAGYASGESEAGGDVDKFSQGIAIHLDDVPPENMDAGKGWSISDFRLPLGAHNGCGSTLFRARFLPGATHRKHRHDNCEEIYHVISGRGVAGSGAGRHEMRGGHFHYIPAGVEHWLVNRNAGEPIEVVGIYIGAGSVVDTGYVYTGDVTDADLA